MSDDRMREELAAPGGKLQPQLQEAIQDCKKLDQLLQSVIAERNMALRLVGEHEAESRRLREELAAAQETIRTQESMLDDRDALAEKLSAAELDAERYRWWRDHFGHVVECVVTRRGRRQTTVDAPYEQWNEHEGWSANPFNNEEMFDTIDAAIDAAMAKEKRDE